jgi:hypothetical protein
MKDGSAEILIAFIGSLGLKKAIAVRMRIADVSPMRMLEITKEHTSTC